MVRFSLAFEGDKPIDQYPRLAEIMEHHKFYSMQIYEHLPYRPAWPIVFHTAKYTRKLLIGPVTVPVFLYDPLTLARNLATLDELTDGRAILGISRGAYPEYMTTEVDRSIGAVLKSVALIASILSGEEYLGRKSPLGEKRRLTWPLGRRAEIYVGTSGPKLCSEASKLKMVKGIIVDNLWNPLYAEQLRRIIDQASAKAGRVGRVQLIARPFTMISKDRADAERKIMPILREYLPNLVGKSPMLNAAGLTSGKLQNLKQKDYRIPSEVLDCFVALGTPADIIEKTNAMLKAGVDHVSFGHPLGEDIPETINLIGKKIIPNFAG